MRIIDTIPTGIREQMSASLQAGLLRVYHEADDQQEKADAVTLIAQLHTASDPAPVELEDFDYADLTFKRDDLGSFSVDSSHPEYVGPEADV